MPREGVAMKTGELGKLVQTMHVDMFYRVETVSYPRAVGGLTVLQPALDDPGKWEIYRSSMRTVLWVETYKTEEDACRRMYKLLYEQDGEAPPIIPEPPRMAEEPEEISPAAEPAPRYSVVPGWYTDPENCDAVRWWTGNQWGPPTGLVSPPGSPAGDIPRTSHTTPFPAASLPAPRYTETPPPHPPAVGELTQYDRVNYRVPDPARVDYTPLLLGFSSLILVATSVVGGAYVAAAGVMVGVVGVTIASRLADSAGVTKTWAILASVVGVAGNLGMLFL